MKKLRFIFKQDGTVDIDAVSGFIGEECKKAMKHGVDALEGETIEETKKQEYWQTNSTQNKETAR